MAIIAHIYRRKNGDYGSSCGMVQDTGHRVERNGNLPQFTVWSVHDEARIICAYVTQAEAEKAIAADWRGIALPLHEGSGE